MSFARFHARLHEKLDMTRSRAHGSDLLLRNGGVAIS
jgi:hypothetical protein